MLLRVGKQQNIINESDGFSSFLSLFLSNWKWETWQVICKNTWGTMILLNNSFIWMMISEIEENLSHTDPNKRGKREQETDMERKRRKLKSIIRMKEQEWEWDWISQSLHSIPCVCGMNESIKTGNEEDDIRPWAMVTTCNVDYVPVYQPVK